MADLELERIIFQHEVAIRAISEWLAQEHPSFNSKIINDILSGKEKTEELDEE